MMSATTGSELSSIGPQQELPEFVERLDEKNCCPICENVLRQPLQTICGHRLCETCLEVLFTRDGIPARCPVNEEQCGMLSRDNETVWIDYAARREIKQLKVYCTNKGFGCEEILPWGALEKHTSQECKKNVIDCPYGCSEQTTREQLKHHEVKCSARPKPCKFSTFGCQFRGSKAQLEQHQKDMMHHMELVILHVGELGLQNEHLRDQLQKSENDKDILQNRLAKMSKEHETMKMQYAENDKRHRMTQKTVASLSEKFYKHEELAANFARKEDVAMHSRELEAIKQAQRLTENRITGVEEQRQPESGFASGLSSSSLSSEVSQHDRLLTLFNVRLAEVDLRLQMLETASYNGILLWKIRGYQRRKSDARCGKTISLYSQPFYTSEHGYKMCARVYLNGDGIGKGSHISLFFVVMKGDYDAVLQWPFRQKVTLMLLDQVGQNHLQDTFRPDPSSSSFQRPTNEMNVASGCPLFVSHSVVEGEGSRFCKDDTIFIKVIVDRSDLHGP